ncbi:Protein farnesyltransferase/geranylgeranyltransferase type-1 subunit alpha [Schistosoma japonicum]|uniref:Protein farnesyltransferase/geranylgeranyltransferase type-1 subunit alpha n=1 Tax=Schistosoma japonicum TaxID=6182 RepID=A0A4Z2CMP8_SCHJA|nr:Protein farnesyltransferase/geranylgeranyltransferase type-1 subunit alpha [Schistosoma japonicum]TNN05538.1 Protein farnesyltransferase/geranylgeranyltransferase type-1 subunit alpha [Schistosoma japonicum]TNN05539.1 Protein farnesyltransferase/geranylgeranyltransferase type-1 subunit alpha [Schistosoma japonicum]TNN05540.1 Protein farnesyltransferase/geranylgeranyltransferase type-1 subunit alpha [Schistosoma japonicum]TNN05541.1 Protein farnesyltransferase/geranylgeranyltransferase type-1
MSTREKYVFYRDRQEWDDINPIPQDDGGRHIVKIAYSEEFVDAHDYFRAALMKDERSERTFSLTSDILLFNPANYTAWEYRRRIIEEISPDLNDELRFVDELIEEYSKNYQLWHHRQWVVEKLSNQNKNDSAFIIQLGSNVLDFVGSVISDDPKNYHAWQHRRWTVTFFKVPIEKELAFTEQMLVNDVHNNSAWNHRYYIVMCDEGLSSATLQREIDFVQKRISFAPNNESSWNYFYGLLMPIVRGKNHIHLPSERDDVENLNTKQSIISKLQIMRRFAEELIMSDSVAGDCLAPLSFLVEVYTDCLESYFAKEPNDTHRTQPSPDIIPVIVDESNNISYDAKDIFDKAINLCERLASEVDRIRANYWQYRARQLTCFAKNVNLIPEITIS